MVIFKGLDGRNIYISPAWVQLVRPTTPTESLVGAKAKVILSGESVFLPDDPETIVEMLNAG
jgi:hypothetical protein